MSSIVPKITAAGPAKDSNFLLSRLIIAVSLIGMIVLLNLPEIQGMRSLAAHYLPIHTCLELVGILVSFSIFMVGWATYQNARSTDILLLSVISFSVGCLDIGHTLSYAGMPEFVTPSSPNKAIYFWLASRFTGTLGFLVVSLSGPRSLQTSGLRGRLMIFMILWTAFWFWIILFKPHLLPEMFLPQHGLQPIKIILEWITVFFSLAAAVLFFRQGFKQKLYNLHWIGCASVLFAIGGFFFTLYRDYYGLYNLAGHVYKTIAFLLVYRAVFVECVSRPYEDARRLASEALAANVSKTRFLANVSHEFRTPLGVITGFTEMFLDSKDLTTENRRWAETISRNAKQLRFLIDDLLDLAKAENEKISIQWSSFSPVEVVEDVINSMRLQAEKKGITIRFQAEVAKAEQIASDRVRFRQILMNLVSNAVKFTPKGSVQIFLRRKPGDLIEVTVQDSGIGIPEEGRESLFQPFSQVNDPLRRHFGGTGLGLALSKKLAVLLGGDLWLEHSEPRLGSVFAFTVLHQTNVPLEALESDTPDDRKTMKLKYDFSGLRILVAEDSPDNQSLLTIYLRSTKVEIVFANNGREALERSRDEHFDLILMDIQMPEMDGFEAVHHIRDEGWSGPILALSAHAHRPERERALMGGFDGYLVKPIARDRLCEALALHLGRPPAEVFQ